jgi:hypothetical protein
MKTSSVLFLALAASVLCSPVHAEPAKDPADAGVVQKLAHGEINWTKRMVMATGSGAAKVKDGGVAQARLMAERAAKLDAIRNMLETVQGMQVSSTKSAGEAMLTDGNVKSTVEGLARGFRVVDTKYYSDGSVDVIVSMPIDQQLTNVLVAKPKASPAPLATAPAAGGPSGLVINAKGLGLNILPSMAPRIVDEAGNEVYGANMVSDVGRAKGSLAQYLKSADDSAMVAGPAPVVVKALRLADKSKTDIVISNADGEKLRAGGVPAFLASANVVILVD